jgi:hypothetical protein
MTGMKVPVLYQAIPQSPHHWREKIMMASGDELKREDNVDK